MAKDFRKKSFGKAIRGYSPEEVDEYIAHVNEEYAKVEHRAADFERKMILALKKLDELTMEKAAADAKKQEIIAAKEAAVREAESIIAEAQSEAEDIKLAAERAAEAKISEAKAEGKKIIDEARAEAAKSSEKASGMYAITTQMFDEVCSFRDQLFLQYNAHIEAIEGISSAAKEYMARVDSGYSDVTGEIFTHDESAVIEVDDRSAEENAHEVLEEILPPEIEPEAEDKIRDIYIDLEDEFDDEDFDEDEFEKDEFEEDEPFDDDEKDDGGAMSRVLRLSALSEAIVDEENNYGFGDDEYDEDYPDDEYADDGESFSDEEIPDDFDEISQSFREMDTLFNSGKKKDLSLTDEFDIVFSGADTGRNIEEIRRQPIVASDSNKNHKKHKNY